MELGGIDIFDANTSNSKSDTVEPLFDSDIDELLINLDETLMNDGEREISNNNKTIEVQINEKTGIHSDQPPEKVSKTDKTELLNFIDKGLNKNTKTKTDRDAKKFLDFLTAQGELRDVTQLSASELDYHIGNFFMELKKPNGEPYEPCSITSIHSSIDRFLRQKGCDFSMKKSSEFQTSQSVVKTKRKLAKQAGLGNCPNRAQAMTPQDEDKLWAARQMGSHSPIALLRGLWFLTTKLMGHRGRHESRQMKWGDITVNQDDTGRFLEFTERSTKTRTGESKDTRPFAPRAYANIDDPSRCPVELYEIYSSHRPVATLHKDAPFYLAVNHMIKHMENARSWFKTSAIGQNTIGAFVKTMAQNAGLNGKFTNHSVRKTTCTNLLQAGVPPTLIQQISGHKDVKSLTNYATASREQVCQMNRILSNPNSIRSNAVATVSVPDENAATPKSLPLSTVSAHDENVALQSIPVSGQVPSASGQSMMMLQANSTTSGLFQSATFENCTFNIHFSNVPNE